VGVATARVDLPFRPVEPGVDQYEPLSASVAFGVRAGERRAGDEVRRGAIGRR
jgi:hypothetical protein